MSELQGSHLWNFGPEWLKFGHIQSALPEMSEECTRELKTSSKNTHNLAATEIQPTIVALLECRRFGSFQRLMRVTAYVLRAIRHFKGKRACQVKSFSNEELHATECQWIKDSQVNLSGERYEDTGESVC